MTKGRISALVAPDKKGSLEWEAVVPIATNPFTLVELIQASLVGAGVALVIMASGLWVMGGGLHPGDVSLMLGGAAVFFAVVSIVFLVIAFVLFGNRYFALYHLTRSGIYYRATRGWDESGTRVITGTRPVPVIGTVAGKKTREKDLPWDKIDHFIDFSSMRSVLLKRGRWQMLRLYTPDAAIHAQVVAYLTERLAQSRA